jgi:hypothetical protein
VNYDKLAIRRFLLEHDVEKFRERKKNCDHDVNVKFYKISDCPTFKCIYKALLIKNFICFLMDSLLIYVVYVIEKKK